MNTIEAAQIMEKASRLVTTWSPWWLKFLKRVEFSYSEEYSRITGLSSMIFLVDTKFLASSSIMEIAVALEYALQQASRRMDVKVHSLKNHYQQASYSLISLACSLEINSDIEYKFNNITQSEWECLIKKKIDNSFIDSYNARKKPSLPDSTYTYKSFGFPPELTADSYLELLLEKEEKKERDWLDEQDEKNKEENEKDRTVESEQTIGEEYTEGEPIEGEPTEGEPTKGKPTEGEPTKGKPTEGEPTEGEPTEGKPTEGKPTEGEPTEGKPTEGEPTKGKPTEGKPTEGEPTEGKPTEGKPTEGKPTEGEPTEGELEDRSIDNKNLEGSNSNIDLDTSSFESGNSTETFVPFEKELRQNSEEVNIHQMTIPEKPKELQDTIGATESEKNSLEKALAQEVSDFLDRKGDYSEYGSGGFGLSKDFIEWSKTKLRVPKTSWKKALPRLLNKTTGKAMLSGMTDLSFSKRNPNQQENSPLMMGLITYPPTVNIIIDASPSMRPDKEKVLSEFISIVSHFYLTYGEPIGIIVADNGIKYYKRVATVSKHIKKVVGRTYLGGSRGTGSGDGFGDTMKKVMRGKARNKGGWIPKADITIIFTDGGFDWPYRNNSRLPSSVGEVIIVCTRSFNELKSDRMYPLPKWVKNKRNFIEIN